MAAPSDSPWPAGREGSAGAATPGEAVLFQTHRFGGAEARAFARLQRGAPAGSDVRVLMSMPDGARPPPRLDAVPHEVIRPAELRPARYPRKSAPGPQGWDITRDGHTDLLGLAYWRRRPSLRRLWVVEYDVRFSGDWAHFFAAFEASRAGLIAAAVRRRDHDPDWVHWQSWHFGPAWPARMAGQFAAFMPVFRASGALLAAVDAAYAGGAAGHVEIVWPSLAMALGLGVEDLGGLGPFVAPDNRGRFYTATPGRWDLRPGSFCYRPVRIAPGLRRNRLWHPVKPLHEKLADDLRRLRDWAGRGAGRGGGQRAGQRAGRRPGRGTDGGGRPGGG